MSNAVNNSNNRSSYILLILSCLIAVGPFSLDAYLPAIPMIAEDLNASIAHTNLSVSSFLFGLGVGQFFGGPISDQIGRRKNVIIGLCIFIIASCGIVFSQSINQILILRFIQAFGAGFATVVGLPTVRDIYSPQKAAEKIPIVVSVMFIAPMIAPVFGTVLMQLDWRAIFVFLIVYALTVILLFSVVIGETRPQLKTISFKHLYTQGKQVIQHQVAGRYIALRYIFIAAFASGAFLTFLTNASWTYMTYFGLSEFQFPLFFAIHLFSFLIANVLISSLVRRIDPFFILKFACIMQVSMLMLLLILEKFVGVNLYTYILLVFFSVGPGAAINSCVMALLFAYFKRLTGSVVSLISLTRSVVAASLGGLSLLFFNDTLIPALAFMLLSALICLGIAYTLPHDTLKSITARPAQEDL